MQNEPTLGKISQSKIKISTKLDLGLTTKVTRRLYSLILNKKIVDAKIRAKQGSLVTDITVGVLSSFAGEVMFNICKSIWDVLRDSWDKKGGNPNPVKIVKDNLEIEINGHETLDELLSKIGKERPMHPRRRH